MLKSRIRAESLNLDMNCINEEGMARRLWLAKPDNRVSIMARRYLFLCTDGQTASGGIAVIYDTVSVLNRAGYNAAILHGSPTAGYLGSSEKLPLYYSQAYRAARRRFDGRREWLTVPLRMLIEKFRGGPLTPLTLDPEDVIVVPEIMIAAAMIAFPRSRLGVFVQNPFSFQRAHAEGMARGLDIRQRADWYLGVSQVCLDLFELLDVKNSHYLPVSMKPEEFPFCEEKQPVITYMPRKRMMEAQVIVDALTRRGKLGGYRLQALDRMSRLEISGHLQRSQMFISLQQRESIGFPAAEAMAAGCIVVGYTGLGGREYFTTETGVPVTEDDTIGLVRAVEETVSEYGVSPVRLDAVRRHASRFINSRYSRVAFETSLLRIWRDLERRVLGLPQASTPEQDEAS